MKKCTYKNNQKRLKKKQHEVRLSCQILKYYYKVSIFKTLVLTQGQSEQWKRRESSETGPNTKENMIKMLTVQWGAKSIKDPETAAQSC